MAPWLVLAAFQTVVVTGAYEPIPLEEADRAVRQLSVDLTGSRYEEIAGVPMPGRGVMGGIEMVIFGRR